MKQMYLHMLNLMDAVHKDFTSALPAPVWTPVADGWGYRFEDRGTRQAVVLKLAFIQSGLRAALVLLEVGHVLEQAIIQRVVDEAGEDVTFMTFAEVNGDAPELLKRYLDVFWAEEFGDGDDVLSSHQERAPVPRRKIRAYVGRSTDNSSRAVDVSKVLSNAYSGFVHAASPHIMEMYVGSPPHFCTRGMLGTHRVEEYERDLWNYMYRGLLAHMSAALLFGSEQHWDMLKEHRANYEALMDKRYGN